MDTRTGEIVNQDEIPHDQLKHFIPVERDLSVHERLDHQILLYSPCGCGSNKKFKFCCHKKKNP